MTMAQNLETNFKALNLERGNSTATGNESSNNNGNYVTFVTPESLRSLEHYTVTERHTVTNSTTNGQQKFR